MEDFKELINNAIMTAFNATKDEVKANQINQLQEILGMPKTEEEALKLLQAFTMRQTVRGPIGKKTAGQLISNIQEISKAKSNKRDKTQKYLGLLKWMYEVWVKIGVKQVDLKIDNAFEKIVSEFLNWCK
ncbi:MAG: hypothetical protein ACFFD2_06520 [Promethearchaeota archaeon]